MGGGTEEFEFTCSLQLLDHINFPNKRSERGCEKKPQEQINETVWFHPENL